MIPMGLRTWHDGLKGTILGFPKYSFKICYKLNLGLALQIKGDYPRMSWYLNNNNKGTLRITLTFSGNPGHEWSESIHFNLKVKIHLTVL